MDQTVAAAQNNARVTTDLAQGGSTLSGACTWAARLPTEPSFDTLVEGQHRLSRWCTPPAWPYGAPGSSVNKGVSWSSSGPTAASAARCNSVLS